MHPTKDQKLRVIYIHNGLRWSSYSHNRTWYEGLLRHCNVVETRYISASETRPFHLRNTKKADVVIVNGYQTPVPKTPVFKAVMGASDPPWFNERRLLASDVYFTISEDVANHYTDKAVYLPHHTDPRYFKEMKLPKVYDCVFAGRIDHKFKRNRYDIITALRRLGLYVLFVGGGGGKNPNHPDDLGFVDGEKLVHAYCSAKFSIDLTNQSAEVGSRLFQAASCGVASITIDRPDIRKLFVEEKEILFYPSAFEAAETILRYVDSVDHVEIGRRAKERALAEHTIDHRVQRLITEIKTRKQKKDGEECRELL